MTIPRRRIAVLGWCLGLCLLLGACSSATNFFYNRLHVVLPWYLGRYVDLDRTQAERFDRQLDTLLAWHRREELPRYVALLEDVRGRLDGPVTVQDIVEVSDAAEEAWYRLRNRGLDELLLLGADLDEEQIDGFIDALEKKQEKYQRKYLRRDDDEYREDAADNLAENLEDYLGSLDAAQYQRVEAASAELIRSDTLWLDERRLWIDMLRRELQREPGWQSRVKQQIRDWESTLEGESARAYEHNTRVVQSAIAAVVDGRSEGQDQRLRRELAQLQADLRELAAEAGRE